MLAQGLTNKGKEFWVSYPYHWYFENGGGGQNSQEMVLYFSAEQNATVTVTSKSSVINTWTRTYNVAAGTVVASDYIPKAGGNDARLYDLPVSFGGNGGEGLYNKGIRIQSTVPIVVYAHYIGSATSGAAMLFPTEAYGYEYWTINNEQSYTNSYTYFYVMAANDNTTFEITPSALTRTGKAAGVPFTVTLNKHQAYQVIANSLSGDLTGSKIKSIANSNGECLPIAVFSGTSRTGLSCSGPGGGSGDFAMQQAFPVHAWGKKFLTAPTSNASGPSSLMTNIYRVIVKDPTTVVKKNGSALGPIINNRFYHFTSGTADVIEADKPVMVAQYMSSTGACPNTGGDGDPEMMYISPIEQAINRVGFYRNDEESINSNYLTMVIPNGGTAISSLMIDGQSFNSILPGSKHRYTHPQNSSYDVIIRRWTAEKKQCIVQSDSAFTAITYGLGSVESYGYNAGTYLRNLNAESSIHNVPDTTTGSTHGFNCKGTPVNLSILMRYEATKLLWKLSSMGTLVTPNTDVTLNNPTWVDTVRINGIKYYKYDLPGNYVFNDTGTHNIPVYATSPSNDNCNNTELVYFTIIVKATPQAGFTITHSGCIKDTVIFSGPAASANGYTINKWNWNFGDATTDNTQNPNKVYAATGTYNVSLSVITTDGCSSDSIRPITIVPVPAATVSAAPPDVCIGNAANLTGSSTFNGTVPVNNYYWDFGDGNTLNTPSPANQNITYGAVGTYTVKYVAKVSETCVSDTATATVNIRPKPVASFTYPPGCLDANGLAQFNSTSTVATGSIGAWLWNFGDPNATGLNPNTSAVPNPSHTYSLGTYTVSLTVGSDFGCSDDTAVTITFSLRPTLSYPPLNPVCESAPAFSIANATVTNGVPGSGVYRGMGTNTAGIFDPAVAGYGTHTIWYVYTVPGGCVDSVSQTILVHAKPQASFVYPSAGCLPPSGLVQFTNATSIADGQTLSYVWNFGDGSPTETTTSPSHNYSFGNYTIALTATSSQGCVDDTIVNATFNIKPVIAYSNHAPVCQSAAPVNIATASVTNGVPGTGSYFDPSGNNAVTTAGMFNPALAGYGSKQIGYAYQASGGCNDTAYSTIVVYAKPVINSITYPSGCLDANGSASFAHTSSIPDGQTFTYTWTFGDPGTGGNNTSTQQNPSHTYTSENNYTVLLSLTSSNGCQTDSSKSISIGIKPAVTYPALTAVCEDAAAYSVATASVTNGISGTGAYSGPGVSASGTFTPSVAGYGTKRIWYVFTTTGGCKDSAYADILVNAKPVINTVTYPSTCLGTNGLASFAHTSSVPDAQTLSYLWNFGDASSGANTATTQNATHTYTAEGNYNITITVTSNNGCVRDSVKSIAIGIKPVLNAPALTEVCENVAAFSVANVTATNGVTGTAVYSGPGVNASGTFDPAVAGYGTHNIKTVFTTTGGCIDSVTRTILVNAKPRPNFTYPSGCIDVSGLVQFTNTSSIPDGQTMTYAWNFADPNANTSNPNTSTAISPSHNYTAFGTYAIVLSATSDKGCVRDTTINATFSLKPSLSYAPLTSVCQSASALSIASATVTNGVVGNGVYSGPGTSANGMFDPAVAGHGTHTIKYTFTATNGGCIDSALTTIKVHPQPVADFTISAPSICLDQTATFTNTSTIPTGTIREWHWDFDNSYMTTATNGNAITQSFATHRTYDVKLFTVSDSGCISTTTTKQLIVNPLPVANFTLPASVCMPGNAANFTNTSTIADGSTLSYQWSFGDGNTATTTNGSHVYGSSAPVSVTLTATSAAGCAHDTTKAFAAFFDKPLASFAVSPDTLCQGTPSAFLDNSTAPNSTIQSRLWTFDDATTSTLANFSKTYPQPGTYSIKLEVTSAQGCIDDTTRSVTVYLQPVVDAGPSFAVPQGTTVIFNPTVNDSTLTFAWTPAVTGLSDPTILRPSYIANADGIFYLTVTGDYGCTATDSLSVRVLRALRIPNAFSPNKDGVNDTWVIENLADYPSATMEVYNRYGQVVYRAVGYAKPWDGTKDGKELPVGTYYYIIEPRSGFKPVTGYVVLLK